MSKLYDWIEKNVKEGTDLDEAKTLIGSQVESVTDIAGAITFINGNDFLKRGFDSEVSKAVDSYSKKFESDKLPVLQKEWKESVTKELRPEETEDQKRIRELEDKLSASDKRDSLNSLKSSLRSKAKEIGFDTVRADRYSIYGDEKAEDFLIEDHKANQNIIKLEIEKNLKGEYKETNPSAGEKESDFDLASTMAGKGFLNK